MTVAPSIEAETKIESVPLNRGISPLATSDHCGGAKKSPAKNPAVITASIPMITASKIFWRFPWRSRTMIDAAPIMTPDHKREIPKRRLSAIAPPITSARSVAAATTSACSQNRIRLCGRRRSPRSAGSDFPVTMPNFAERYWTSMAERFERISTHTKR